MQWSLFVLILMGQCAFFTCHLYEYHFINETKTWTEAQRYCRKHYTDLATVTNKTDTERLCDCAKNEGGAWIGLHNETGTDNMTWHWSQPGVEFKENETNWASGEPNNRTLPENCVRLAKPQDYKLSDQTCQTQYKFVCYDDDPQAGGKFHFINITKSWPDAQSYCRDNHTDLVSGLDQLEEVSFMSERRKYGDLWIGLFRDTWRWSDGSNFSFRDWEDEEEEDNKKCAMTVNGKWSSDKCNESKPFFCYDDKVILINEMKTWEQALNHCRKHHGDLVSITNPHQQRWVQERAKQAGTAHVWVGLRYSCFLDLWFWVNDNVVCYNNWAPGQRREVCGWAAAMRKGGAHEWIMKDETNKFNFICTVRKV